MFRFNQEKFDFWEIYQSIIRFYPIGVLKDEGNLYASYTGFKDLEKILVNKIHDTNNFVSTWKSFTNEIEAEIQKEIIGTTYGQAPSYSSYVSLDTTAVDNLTRTKELHFFVSLIGPFYTIIGQDVSTIKFDNSSCRSINYLVTSPENEFAATFNLLSAKIEARFEGFRFVPFGICMQSIEGLHVRYSDETNCTIFRALFNHLIDVTIERKIGDCFYKSENWIKAGFLDTGTGWISYPPNM